MAFEQKRNSIHGWLSVIKPIGITSANVVSRLKYFTKAKKVGHSGTLDPLASGIVLIAFGEATKTVSFAMNMEKTYTFVIRWGEATSTDDAEGSVIDTSDFRPKLSDIEMAIKNFEGEYLQTPPRFSAIKVNGARAYSLARNNKEFFLKPRLIYIKSIKLLNIIDKNTAEFQVISGKGMYVRALGRDLALKLNTYGHIRRLRRLAVGPFDDNNSMELDKVIEAIKEDGPCIKKFLKPVETVLDDIPALALTEQEARKISFGQNISVRNVKEQFAREYTGRNSIISAMCGERLVALVKIREDKLCPFRVINL